MTPTSITLPDWLEQWIRLYAPVRCKSRKTLERYQSLANYLTSGRTPELQQIAKRRLAELRPAEVESALLSLFRARAIKRNHLSARTIRHIAGLLSSALGKACRLELIPSNPMMKVELPCVENRVARSLDPFEIAALRTACRGEWTFPFVELALATGCRRGELLALEWPDITHGERILNVFRSLEQTKAGLRIKSTKGGKPRRLTLPRQAFEVLPDLRIRARGGKLVFPAPEGGYRKPDLVSQLIVRRMQQAGIDGASLHSLRHTHASILLSRGVPLPAVAARLGHADPHITARIYGHALPLDDSRAADEWDQLLAASPRWINFACCLADKET